MYKICIRIVMIIKNSLSLLLLLSVSSGAFAMESSTSGSDDENSVESGVTVALINVTDDNREALVNFVKSTYDSEGCGICKQSGAEIFWFSPHSRCAHKACFELIKTAEGNLCADIDTIFKSEKDHSDQNFAHCAAIEAVEEAINKSGESSIKTYFEKHGEANLKKLFDTAGFEGVLQYVRNERNEGRR